MRCPHCSAELVTVGKFGVCPEHGSFGMEDRETTAPKRLRIFLSYGHDSNEILVNQIKADLEARGHDVWFDKTRIKAGDDWRETITQGLLESDRMLSFLSEHSTRDPGVCRDEISIAVGVKGANLLTILVEDEERVQPPVTISHIQWLDMHDWKDRHSSKQASWIGWYSTKFNELARVLESEESARFAGEIDRLSQYLEPIGNEARINFLLKIPFVGRSWLFDAVESWRMERHQTSRLYWITGSPGIGKSAFAARLCHTHGSVVLAAHFCEWDKPDHRSPERVIKSIAFQLASKLPDYRKLLLTLPEITSLKSKNAEELFDYLIVNPLTLAINGERHRCLIVLDGLDEMTEQGFNPMVEILARNADLFPKWLGIVVTSRPEVEILTPLQAYHPVMLKADAPQNAADLRQYLESRLAKQLKGSQVPAHVLEKILKASGGLFLYVDRLCNEIETGYLDLSEVEEFPQGLGGVYYQYFRRQFSDVLHYREHIRTALGIVLAAREPIPLDLLRSLMDWSEEALVDFIGMTGSLFPVSKSDHLETIRPFHRSISEWLQDSETSGPYFVSGESGHEVLAHYGFNTYRADYESLPDYYRRHLPYHLLKANEPISLIQLLDDSRLALFERWAEGGLAKDGIDCLEYLLASPVIGYMADLRSILYSQLARLYNRIGQPEAAEKSLVALTLATSVEDPKNRRLSAVSLHELGSLALARDELGKANDCYRKALRMSRINKPPMEGEIAANLIGLATTNYRKRFGAARTKRLANLALRHALSAHDHPHAAEACRLLADVCKDDMLYAEAATHLNRGLEIADTHQLTSITLSLRLSNAWMTYHRAVLEKLPLKSAQSEIDAFRKMAGSAPDWRYLADAWTLTGQMGILLGDDEAILAALDHLNSLQVERLPPHLEVRRLLFGASQHHRARKYDQAHAIYNQSAEFARSHLLWARAVDSQIGKGAALYHQGRTQEAKAAFSETDTLLRKCARVRKEISQKSIERIYGDPKACHL